MQMYVHPLIVSLCSQLYFDLLKTSFEFCYIINMASDSSVT